MWFSIVPQTDVRLSHGRLGQLPMRDPTNRFDFLEHLTCQMSRASDHDDMGSDAIGILGEALASTVGANGSPILLGKNAIRGTLEKCECGK